MGKINPDALMYYTDGYKQLPKAKIKGRSLELVAYQLERPKRYLGIKRRIKNHVYIIAGTEMVVYANKPNAIAVMKMGLSLKRLIRYAHSLQRSMHPKSVSAEQYYKYFSNPHLHADWLRRNKYVLPHSS